MKVIHWMFLAFCELMVGGAIAFLVTFTFTIPGQFYDIVAASFAGIATMVCWTAGGIMVMVMLDEEDDENEG